MTMIPCLTVRQPYATAILLGLKTEEYRTWSVSYRGLLLIHAAKAKPEDCSRWPNLIAGKLPRGVLLGAIELVGVEAREGRTLAWILRNPRWFPLACRTPVVGKLGIWYPAGVDVSLLER